MGLRHCPDLGWMPRVGIRTRQLLAMYALAAELGTTLSAKIARPRFDEVICVDSRTNAAVQRMPRVRA
eukprot:9073381-Pyramimonas_sp.AAC.1